MNRMTNKLKGISLIFGLGLCVGLSCLFGCGNNEKVITKASSEVAKRNFDSAMESILELSDREIVKSDTLCQLLSAAYYGNSLKPVRDIANECYDLDFMPDGKTIIFSDYQTGALNFYSFPDMKATRTILLPSRCFGVDVNSDGSLLAAAMGNKNIAVYDLATGEKKKEWIAHDGAVRDVKFGDNGELFSCGNDQRVKAWHLNSDKPEWTKHSNSRNIKNIGLNANHSRLVTASNDGMASIIYLYGDKRGREEGKLPCSDNYLNGAAFSQDGKFIATATGDGHLQTWNVDNHKLLHDIVMDDHLGGLAISPDSKHIIVGGEKNAYIIDAEAGKVTGVMPGRNMPIWAVAFIDNNHFAFADNTTFWHGEILEKQALVDAARKIHKAGKKN